MTTIAVTGATGKLGRATLQFLLARGPAAESIRPIVRDLAKAHDLVDRKFDVAYGNYTDPALLEAAFSGVDKLLFISTSALGEERMLQHRNVVNAAKGAGVKHIIYTSVVKPAAVACSRSQSSSSRVHSLVAKMLHPTARVFLRCPDCLQDKSVRCQLQTKRQSRRDEIKWRDGELAEPG